MVVEPGSVSVRVRSLQNHDRSVEGIHRGQRAAINLVGIHHDETRRGQEICTPGYLTPSRLLTVQCNLLPSAPPLKDRSRVRVHLGTAELIASVRLLGSDRLERGQQGRLQLFLNEPAVATWRQPFVLRQESPVTTVGGGHVLVPAAQRMRRVSPQQIDLLQELLSEDPLTRAAAALYFHGLQPWKAEDLSRMSGVDNPEHVTRELLEAGVLVAVRLSPTRTLVVHRQLLQEVAERIQQRLGKLHDAEPLRTSFPLASVLRSFDYVGDAELVKHSLKLLQQAKVVHYGERGVGLAARGPKLSQNERKLLQTLIEQYQRDGLAPETVEKYQKRVSKNQASVPQLIQLAAADGHLIELSADLYLHAEVEGDIRQKLQEEMRDGRGCTLSEIREILNTTRKYAIPLCEYYDRIGFTTRDGDLRRLSPTLEDAR